MDSQLIRVRIKETGQIVDLIPAVAHARIGGGTAERVVVNPRPETAAVKPAERAVSTKQDPPKKAKSAK